MTFVFDLDGTLISCKARQVSVLRAIINAQLGRDTKFEYDQWWELKRNGFSTSRALVSMGFNEELSERLAKLWVENIENFEWSYLDMPFDDSIEILSLIKELGHRSYILTARRNRLTLDQQVWRFSFDRYIDKLFMVDPSNAASSKAVILKEIGPRFYVGDTESDLQSSKISETPFIGLNRGQRSQLFLKERSAGKICNNLLEIVPYLEGKELDF